MKVKDGLTLIEVILSMAIISIVLITFSSGFASSFINISNSKNITIDTFKMQGLMENQLHEFSVADLDENSLKIEIFDQEIKYKKITVGDKRTYTSYISTPNIGRPETPEINEVVIKAYKGNEEVFPWFEEGVSIIASYNGEDPLIFSKNYSWYKSKKAGEKPIINPRFSVDYDVFKYKNSVEKGKITDADKKIDYKDLENNSYYYFTITPYSYLGRMGRMAINQERLLVIERGKNPFLNQMVEDIYLKKENTKLEGDSLILVMNNPEELTLNIENNNSSEYSISTLFYPIPDKYKSKNDDLIVYIENRFDEKSIIEKDGGFGVFIGESNTGNGKGININIDSGNNKLIVGDVNYNTKKQYQHNMPEDFNWSSRYKWRFEIQRNKKSILISYKDLFEENQEYKGNIEIPVNLDFDFEAEYIGLKNWSNYAYEDETTIEHKYVYNITSHFYDIDFEKKINFPIVNEEEFGDSSKFYQGSGNSRNLKNGEIKSNERIRLDRKDMQVTGQGNDNSTTIKAKSFNITDINIHTSDLFIKVEEYVVFEGLVIFKKNNKKDYKIEISAINEQNYPIFVYFKNGDKIKIKSGKIALTKGENNNINIIGDNFTLIKPN